METILAFQPPRELLEWHGTDHWPTLLLALLLVVGVPALIWSHYEKKLEEERAARWRLERGLDDDDDDDDDEDDDLLDEDEEDEEDDDDDEDDSSSTPQNTKTS